jgi:putative flippase GtrA
MRRRGVICVVRSLDPRLPGQGLRFAIAGGLVAAVYVLATLLFSHVFGLPFEVALLLGFAVALTTHFTLQRLFVWPHDAGFALPIHHQVGRYLGIAAAQYAITASATAILPGALNVATDLVYLGVTATVSVANFLLFRTHVFHSDEPEAP